MIVIGGRQPSEATMFAAFHENLGDPLQLGRVARPEPMAGEVRLKISAAGVNPIDIFTGHNAGYEQALREGSFIPGWDVAGVVDAVGYGVARHRVGDRLFGLAWFPHPAGAYAEYLTVPAHHLVAMPDSVSFAEAASLPMAALTAMQMLDAAGVTAGHRVLISGASGGVGHLAVQLAALRGADVIALARPADHETLLSMGAASCVDYADAEAIRAIEKVDALIDLVGGDFGRGLFVLVQRGGSAALSAGWSIPSYQSDAAEAGIEAVSCLVDPDPEGLKQIAALVDEGSVRVVVGAEFSLTQAAEAQRWVTGRRGFGKAVITTDSVQRR